MSHWTAESLIVKNYNGKTILPTLKQHHGQYTLTDVELFMLFPAQQNMDTCGQTTFRQRFQKKFFPKKMKDF